MERRTYKNGVTLVGSSEGPVAFAFTERTGGVSHPPFSSLNLGTHVGDDPAAVGENRRRVLEALGCEDALCHLIVPNQVHGDHVAVVRSPDEEALDAVRAEVADGADAVVCTLPGVPVLLCFADCVPVLLTCERGFAVVHSGWKGTIAGIAAKAARVLAQETGAAPREIRAYIGPHITGAEYEVSTELIERFAERFPGVVAPGPSRLLDLAACIRAALGEAGVPAEKRLRPRPLHRARERPVLLLPGGAGTLRPPRCGRHHAVGAARVCPRDAPLSHQTRPGGPCTVWAPLPAALPSAALP